MKSIQNILIVGFYIVLIISIPVLTWISGIEHIKQTIWETFFSNLSTGISIALLINLIQWFRIKYITGGRLNAAMRLSEELRRENCLPRCVDSVVQCQKIIKWGLECITEGRRTFAGDKEKFFINAQQQVDVIAFGLRNARELNTPAEVAKSLNNGNYRIRLICPDPDGYAAKHQDLFETPPESRASFEESSETATSIKKLIEWVSQIKTKLNADKKSSIEIKMYSDLPLFFYMRIDSDLFVGPYILGNSSKNSITFHFKKGGKGFDYFEEYFKTTWDTLEMDSSNSNSSNIN